MAGQTISLFTYIVLIIAFVAFGLGRGALVDSSGAVEAARAQGFSQIEVVDTIFAVGLRGCSEKDAARFDLAAVNSNGEPVEFYVCSGWPFKGFTIRH